MQESGKKILDDLKKPPNTLDLAEIEKAEAQMEAEKRAHEETATRGLLEGLRLANVKFHLMTGSLDKLYEKKKYANLFDIGVLSVASANMISKDFSRLFKDHAKVHCETADFMVILKQEQREEFRNKLIEKIRDARWTVTPKETTPFTHHMLFEVHQVEDFGKAGVVATITGGAGYE